ncbi:MAG: bifunctional hydroxymethylpyrimidine kinase/phosphomethylpyrimidine kinase [Proteobacteria bacterium]|nr:bifunctional hydroxymethylpyrimidine kinase/phosphomethylpyrimidine kinase [Pseudomonadota bacterium]MBU1716070.1 bifunctional hydroxymethylpyrimidine kinase/phosphomethylpyrimidine kinase [Pseudomonadota bacterium]
MSAPETKVILSIAGSDPSGGAGIQADLKTFAAIGVYGGGAITCLTAQNTNGVSTFLPVEVDFVSQQIKAVLTDMQVTHIKIGMIGTGRIAKAIADTLTDFTGELICDPVLKASLGPALLAPDDLGEFKKHLVGRATVLTPNRDELQTITGLPCNNSEEALTAAHSLLNEYKNLNALVLKGGHLNEKDNQVTDYLLTREQNGPAILINQAVHPRITTRNSHGTGCTMASAFGAWHLLTGDYQQAFHQAVQFIDFLLKNSSQHQIGHGNGPLLHHLWRNN